MFLLGSADFPQTRDELVASLDEGLRLFGNVAGVQEAEGEFPRLDRLWVDLSGAQITSALRPSEGVGQREQGITVSVFKVTGDPVRFEQSPIHVRVAGSDVRLAYDRDAGGRPVLVLDAAREGEIEIRVARAELEAILLSLAREAASAHGVSVSDVAVTLRSRGPRSIDFSVAVAASKLFMKTTVTAAGQVDVDDSLNARISNATCDGSGVIGTLACGFIRPHIAKHEGRSIPLMALPLGSVRLRDLTVEAGESLTVHARLSA